MLEHLTLDTFKEKVFNFENNKDWKFEGDKPCLIDFYADWCGPCKMIAPVLEQLQNEYGDKLNIYKVNTEDERDLASMFGIQSIPSLLFVPTDGKPQMAMGALPKETFEQAFKEIFGVDKDKKIIYMFIRRLSKGRPHTFHSFISLPQFNNTKYLLKTKTLNIFFCHRRTW